MSVRRALLLSVTIPPDSGTLGSHAPTRSHVGKCSDALRSEESWSLSNLKSRGFGAGMYIDQGIDMSVNIRKSAEGFLPCVRAASARSQVPGGAAGAPSPESGPKAECAPRAAPTTAALLGVCLSTRSR